MTANDFNKYGCDLVWQITDQVSGREVARGKHGIMFFDYGVRKPAQLPPAFIANF
jgi:4-hydroxybenzoyl-CoA thioesterase